MERVSILEASRRLNIPQSAIRKHIRDGRLKAQRGEGAAGTGWLVEMPGDDWEDTDKQSYIKMSQELSPWWWPNAARTGFVHYVEDIGIEEIIPQFLCGETSNNIWTANNHSEELRCPECLRKVFDQGLPLTSNL